VGGKADGVAGIRASTQRARPPATVAAIDAVDVFGKTSHQGDTINVDVLAALPVVARDYRYGWGDSIGHAARGGLGARGGPIDDGTPGTVQVCPLLWREV